MENTENKFIYLTVKEINREIILEKNSKFISYIYHIKDIEEANKILAELKKEYSDSNHICFAYILNDINKTWRASDDGEPGGTAGMPIYNQLLSAGLKNVMIAVVRYFGGIKLGVSGLIKAYKNSAKAVIESAKIIETEPNIKLKLIFDYSQSEKVMSYVKQNSFEISNKVFDLECYIEIDIPLSKKEACTNYLNNLNINHFTI